MMLPILQSNPHANYLAHKDEIDLAVARVLESGWYILGKEVAAFEKEFATYLGTEHAIGVASGTDALQVALRACDVGLGDCVLTVSHTAVATVTAIDLCGATPVFVDIDPLQFGMDPNDLEDKIKNLSQGCAKAIVVVHLYGQPVDMPAILNIAQRYDLRVIEDCAQAHGARLHGKQVGTWGDVAAFSFYPTKNLGALGDGGLVATGNTQLAEKVRLIREYGWQERYVSKIPGMNSRLDELQAALLRVKLQHLDEDNQRRRNLAGLYDTLLANSSLTLPRSSADTYHVYHQYVIRTPNRDVLKNTLREQGIGSLIHYPVPVHCQPAYTRFAADANLPHTDAASQEVLSLPIYPELDEAQVRLVAERIVDWAGAQHIK